MGDDRGVWAWFRRRMTDIRNRRANTVRLGTACGGS